LASTLAHAAAGTGIESVDAGLKTRNRRMRVASGSDSG